MKNVELKPINHENWRDCIRLKVAPGQENFVATNAKSLAQAAYQSPEEARWQPKGIYDVDLDKMVGFIMFGLVTFDGNAVWVITRLMLDEQYQRQGYGGIATKIALELMRMDENPATDVYISYVPENMGAGELYAKLGFKDQGMTLDGSEKLMYLSLAE